MKKRKTDEVNLLLDAIGQIDDSILHECIIPYAHKKRTVTWQKMLVIAATLTLITATLLTFALGGLNTQKGENDLNAPSSSQNGTPSSGSSLSIRLRNLSENPGVTTCTSDSIDLLDGSCRIVWKYRDEKEYRVLALNREQYANLTSALSQPSRQIPPDSDDTLPELEGIWLCSSNGTVQSPCLKASAGNEAFADLFVYLPEVEPPKQFTDILCQQIEDAGT